MQFEKRASGLLMPVEGAVGGGTFKGQIIRKGVVIDEWESKNILPLEGLDHMLSVTLTGAAQITTWFMGLFSGNYAPVSTDKASTIVTSAQESTAYSNPSRPQWNALEANQNANNAANPAVFNFNAGATLYGGFIISSSNKSSGSGILFAISQFGSAKTVAASDQLALSYQVGLSSA